MGTLHFLRPPPATDFKAPCVGPILLPSDVVDFLHLASGKGITDRWPKNASLILSVEAGLALWRKAERIAKCPLGGRGDVPVEEALFTFLADLRRRGVL